MNSSDTAGENPVSFLLENIGGSDPPGFGVAEGRAVEFGRAPTCGVSIQNPRISKHHATVRVQGGALFVADRSSTNGTYVNGHRISAESKIFPGDVVQFSQDPALKFLVTVGKPHSHGCSISSRSMAILTIIGADSATIREFGIPDGVRLLGGRSSRANITIADPALAAIHFAVSGEAGNWTIAPVKPECKVLLKDSPILAPTKLSDGDLISVGTTNLRFSLHSAPVAIPGDTDASNAAALPFDEKDDSDAGEGGDIWAREALGVEEATSEKEILDRFAEASAECTKQIESAPNKVIMDWYLKRQKFLEGARDFLLNRLQSGKTMLLAGSCDRTLDESAMSSADGTGASGSARRAEGASAAAAGKTRGSIEMLYRLGPAILFILALIWLGWEIFLAPAHRQKRLEKEISAVSIEAEKATAAGDIEGAVKLLRAIDDDRFDEYPDLRESLRKKIFETTHPARPGSGMKANP